MATLNETINSLAANVNGKQQSFEDALLALQTWIEQNVGRMSDADRATFSKTLNAEKEAEKREGQTYGDDTSLVLSVMRLHALRLLYRFDERKAGRPASDETTPYSRARNRLTVALRESEIALNEARVDTAIANAHHILMDRQANQRWLQDALTRIQTVAQKDLIKLAEAIPPPELPKLSIFQQIGFKILGIRQEEIGKRSLASLRQVAELQNNQLFEMIKLLAESFEALGDNVSAQQAISLLGQLGEN